MVLWPIYVPSKGRAETSKLLHHENQLTVVVEPQDQDEYRRQYGTKHEFLVLPDDDRGLPYARNWIRKIAHRDGDEWFWMLDDDINQFFEVYRGKLRKITMKVALLQAQAQILAVPGVAQGALEYQQFAWANKKGISLNSYCDVCVAIHVGRTLKINFRDYPLKLDRDFTLQVLASGYRTVRVSTVAFGCPKFGTNKGGLFDLYKNGHEKLDSEKFAEAWPGVVNVWKKRDGRWDAKINWKAASRDVR